MSVQPPLPPPTPPPPIFARRGPLLIVADRARLPDRCIKCNEPEACRKTVRLTWHTPTLYLLLLSVCVIGLLGLIVYVIVTSIVARRISIEAGLCARHARRRILHIVAASCVCVVGAAAVVAAIMIEEVVPGLVGGGFVIGGLVYLTLALPIARAVKIDGTVAQVKGCSPAFLRSLTPMLQCTACGYDLRGHGAAEDAVLTCPECGVVA